MDSPKIKTEKLERINLNVNFDSLKSNFILKKIFSQLEKDKFFNIIKYNKKLQKKFNLNINDYKEYYQLYSPIEIELKINDNYYKNFINIPDDVKKYYHIYFNNSNEEIKRNNINKNEKVNNIKIVIDYQVKSFKNLFSLCSGINSIFFKKFSRNNITDMKSMFFECGSLKELDLSNFNTDNVTNMSYLFARSKFLEELNLSNFNTNNVIDMS